MILKDKRVTQKLKMQKDAEILVEVTRNGVVESRHRGHLAIVDGDGNKLTTLGNEKAVTFIRSSAKPFQVLPFLLSGGAEKFGFDEADIALACASHSGEEIHTEKVKKMLEKIGLDESYLKCGAHLPFNETVAEQMIREGKSPTAIHNNCSGKHAMMLAFAKHLGASLENYIEETHQVQRAILKMVSNFAETPIQMIRTGIDGCSAPNFALSVEAMAKAIVKVVSPPDEFDASLKQACQAVVSAMTNHPELVGGTERLDTILMKASQGKIISKIGAEGVWVCGVLPSPQWKRGLGIALKIEDGDDRRARPVVAIELLKCLGILHQEDLKQYSPMPMRNRKGEVVSFARVSFDLRELFC
ncbi:MAG: asparaginase [Acidobacteria bacterium]|nr:MAG: asparaginase [Acidobacteriota bacterium]